MFMKLVSCAALALLLAGCSAKQVASTVTAVDNYQAQVTLACKTAEASITAAAATSGNADVARAATLVHASCDSEAAVESMFTSPTSVAWLNTLITTINSFGKVVPPAPISIPLSAS